MNSETKESQRFTIDRDGSWSVLDLVLSLSGSVGVGWEEEMEVLSRNAAEAK